MSTLTGTRVLLGAAARRDRWSLPWWVLGIAVLYVSQAVSVDGLYATQAEFDRAAEAMSQNAAFVAMAGPARALNTVGGQVTWQSTAFGAVVAGLLSTFLVARHTRAEEESGRDELVRAAAVGRLAPPAAALLTAYAAQLAVGAATAVALAGYGLAVADSVALGVGVTLCGWLFAGTAAIAAQLASTSRGVWALNGLVIAAAYLLRAVGDVAQPALSWLSPIGWYQAMHAFSGLRWWPALLLLAGSVLAVAAARVLLERRDIGSGLLAARPGPPRAGRSLRGSVALAWRLERGTVVGWTLGLFVVGLVYGSMGDAVGELIGDSEASRTMFAPGADVVAGFYATAALLLAVLAAAFAISTTARPRAEEESGRLEVLLATALSRRRWLLGHVAVTLAGTAAVLVAAGLGVGAGYLLVTGDLERAADLAWPVATYAGATLTLAAIARLIAGVAPRLGWLAWLPLLWASVVMLFGDLLDLPQWLQDLSPFEHVALAPAESVAVLPIVVLLAVAAAVSAAGQLAFARRDLG